MSLSRVQLFVLGLGAAALLAPHNIAAGAKAQVARANGRRATVLDGRNLGGGAPRESALARCTAIAAVGRRRPELEFTASNRADPSEDIAVRYDDPDLGIAWPLPVSVISARDSSAGSWADLVRPIHRPS